MSPVITKETFNAFKKIVRTESPGLVQLINELLEVQDVDNFKQLDYGIKKGLNQLTNYPDCHSYYAHVYNGIRATVICHFDDLLDYEMGNNDKPKYDGDDVEC